MKNFLIRLSVLFITISIVSCSKDDDNATPAFQQKFKNLTTADLVPTSMQTKSPEAYAQINQLVSFMAIPNAFMNNPNANRNSSSANALNSSSTYTWTSGEYTVVYTLTETATQYMFNYVGTVSGVEHFQISGWENIDGSAGGWDYTITDQSGGQVSGSNVTVSFEWAQTGANSFDFDMSFTYDNFSYHLVASIIDQNTGNYTIHVNNELNYSCEWDINGGEFTDHTMTPAEVTTWNN